jgi:hypothetical protein
MTVHKYKRLVNSFWDLNEDVQQAVARFLVGSKLSEIVEAAAHGVVEIEINYFRHGTAHKLVWDDTHKKLLGGTETITINEVLKKVSPTAQAEINTSGNRIRNIKIKHADTDDREWLHVHYIDEDNNLFNKKFEMDGTSFSK